jgi:endonuclease/exonuclease/phosphatase (EEP) superfamily protein YafD
MNLANGRAAGSGIAGLVEALEPDVVATQELAPHQARVLERLLPFGMLEPARDHTGMGMALRESASLWRLPMTFRDACVAEVVVPAWVDYPDGVQVINAHLAAPHVLPPWRTLARRRAQLRGIEAHLDAVRRPCALVGDLNSTPMWPAYRRLRARLADGALEVARQRGTRPARTWGPIPGLPRLLRIDHVLVQGLTVLNLEVHPIPGSDHAALLVDLAPDGGTDRRNAASGAAGGQEAPVLARDPVTIRRAGAIPSAEGAP